MIHTLSFSSIEETLLNIFYIFSCVLEQKRLEYSMQAGTLYIGKEIISLFLTPTTCCFMCHIYYLILTTLF